MAEDKGMKPAAASYSKPYGKREGKEELTRTRITST